MPNKSQIMSPRKKRTEGSIYNFEKKLFHEKEIKAAETERKKMNPIKFIRFENGVKVISIHQPVKH